MAWRSSGENKKSLPKWVILLSILLRPERSYRLTRYAWMQGWANHIKLVGFDDLTNNLGSKSFHIQSNINVLAYFYHPWK